MEINFTPENLIEKLEHIGPWSADVIEKYHKEIGYSLEELSNKDYVNEN